MECILNFWDIVFFILGIISSVIVTLWIIKCYKPDILICTPYKEIISLKDDKKKNKVLTPLIKVKIQNCDKKYAAINFSVEICAVVDGFTYHLDLDRSQFIMLERKDSSNKSDNRNVIGHKINKFTQSLSEIRTIDQLIDEVQSKEGSYFRVRAHCCHEYTGFGKVFMKRFCLDKNGKFIPINIESKFSERKCF